MRHNRWSSIATIPLGRVIRSGLLTIGLCASVLFIGGCDYSSAFLVHHDYGYSGGHHSDHHRQSAPHHPPAHHHRPNHH